MPQLERPKNWQDLAAGFVLNNLSDEELMLWKTLCAEDPDLEHEARAMQQTFNQFAYVIPLHAPSQQCVDVMRQTAQDQLRTRDYGRPLHVFGADDVSRHRVWWQGVGVVVGMGAIAFLTTQLMGLNTQVQQLTEQLNDHQQTLQQANTQIADLDRQLNQATLQLTTIENALNQSKDREESMHQLLQQLTQDSPGNHRP